MALVALLACSTSTCEATLSPGNHKYTLSVNGTTRKYTLHVPPQYDGETSIPLLFDLHVRKLCVVCLLDFVLPMLTTMQTLRRPGEATSSSRAG